MSQCRCSTGIRPEDFHGFVNVVPAGPYALAYWQAKGYSLNAVGATMPTPPISAFEQGRHPQEMKAGVVQPLPGAPDSEGLGETRALFIWAPV
jgi:hypothetical protein